MRFQDDIPPMVGSLFSWKSLLTNRKTREDCKNIIKKSPSDKHNSYLPFPQLLRQVEQALRSNSALALLPLPYCVGGTGREGWSYAAEGVFRGLMFSKAKFDTAHGSKACSNCIFERYESGIKMQ